MKNKFYYLNWLAVAMLPPGLAAQDMRINGCYFIMNGQVQLVLHNAGINNNGSFIAGNGTVLFTGNQSSPIAGRDTTVFNNVVISKPAAQVELQQDIAVHNTVDMKNGRLLLNNHMLDLGTTGSIKGEDNQTYITGTSGGRVRVAKNATTAPNALNPGNIGIELTSGSAPGNLVIERKHVQETLYGGIQSIHRSFTITGLKTPVNGPMDIQLRFYYLDHELAGTDESTLNLWTGSDITNGWTQLGNDGINTTMNWVVKTGLEKLGKFTLAGDAGSSSSSNKGYRPVLTPTILSRPKVLPNPTGGKFTLVFYSNVSAAIQLKLYSRQGQLLQQRSVQASTGINTVQWDISAYGAGTYIITDNTGAIKMKAVKQ